MRFILNTASLVAASLFVAACMPGNKDPYFENKVPRQDARDVGAIDPASPLSMMGVEDLWKKTRGKNVKGERTIVALVGSGIDYTIPDLREALWVNPNESSESTWNNGRDDDNNGYYDDFFGWDFYSGDSLPFDWHGNDTFTASLIAATGGKNKAVVGVAPDAALMVARYIGPDGRGNGIDASKALEYAMANGARVIYFNWPAGGFQEFEQDLVIEQIEKGQSKNVLFVIPAGNSQNQDIPRFLKHVAQMNHVMVVAGLSGDGRLSRTTNFGRNFASVAAPSVGASGFMPGGEVSTGIITTSVSAAYVAGIAALVSTLPQYGKVADVKKVLLRSSAPSRDGRPIDVLSEGMISVGKL